MEEEYYGKVYIKYKNGFKVSALDEYRASYDFDENTESTARIKEGEEIDFLADGIMLLEVK